MEEVNTGHRWIEFTLKNETKEQLFLTFEEFKHGRWDSEKPSLVEAGKDCKFKVCSKDSASVGVEGTVIWKGGTDLVDFSLYFMKPYGSGKTEVKPSVSDGKYDWKLEGDISGHGSTLTLTYLKKA